MIFGRKPAKTGTLRPQSFQDYAAAIEQILRDMNVDVAAGRMQIPDGQGWRFLRGSAMIHITLTMAEDRAFFQIYAPILHLPSSGLLPLYRRLLEMNLRMTSAAFGIHNDVVYVFSERPLQGLDIEEARILIQIVQEYADEWDNKLAVEFGARLHQQG